ncbi:MAG: hypothetical protein IPP77_14295 [Bacteroidetes bacterium]|nr:hypothetical protein [Bacteroidota bacterium]
MIASIPLLRIIIQNQKPVYAYLLLLAGFLLPVFSFSQKSDEKKEVEILNADELRFQESGGKKITKLVGNVRLKQDEILMWCDSAHLDKETNSVDAWGHIHIQQDTVNAFSNTLHHDGNRKFSSLQGNAQLSDGNMKLFTNQLFYDVKNRLSYYVDSGRVLKDSTVITSKRGYYYSNTNEVFFKGDVVIKDPDYTLYSDTLKYHTGTKVSTFLGHTEIINAESRIVCSSGWYDSEHNISAFGKNTTVYNPPQQLNADSIFYERAIGFSKVIGPFQWIDSSMGVEILGHYGEYSDRRQYIMATQKPLMIYKMEKDSLLLTGDTLKSMTKSETDTVRNFFAYRNVQLFMKDMQGVCDSLFYSFEDSIFRMYQQPVIWSDQTQMSGDTIYFYTKNRKADHFSIYRSGFIISPTGKKYYDQIKGTNIFGYFEDNEMRRLDVEGNSESLYFGKDEKDKFIGANKAQSNTISLHFENKKIKKIVFIKKPEAVFTPMKMLTKEQMQLKDFKWQIDRKPKSREALLE